MGNTHDWPQHYELPQVWVSPVLKVGVSSGKADTKATEAGLRSVAQSIPQLDPANVETLAKMSLTDFLEGKPQYVQLSTTVNQVNVVRFDIWITRTKSDSLTIEWAKLVATLPVWKYRRFVTLRDGEERESTNVTLGLDSQDISVLTTFMIQELKARVPASKTPTACELAVVPPKFVAWYPTMEPSSGFMRHVRLARMFGTGQDAYTSTWETQGRRNPNYKNPYYNPPAFVYDPSKQVDVGVFFNAMQAAKPK